MNVLFITAFYDVGRHRWSNIARKNNYYIQALINLIDTIKHSIIVFYDDRYLTGFIENPVISNAINIGKLIIIPINNIWLLNKTNGWKTISVAQLFMHSKKYTELLKDRLCNNFPENIYANYNALMHCKIDFIKEAKNLTNFDGTYIWIDAGYLYSIEHKYLKDDTKISLNLDKINTEKITFMLVNPIEPSDFDIINTLVNAKVTVTGSFFIVPSNLIDKLHSAYFAVIDNFNNLGLSDDDQHIYLQCIGYMGFEHFNLVIPTEKKWPQGLTYFSS